MKKFYLLFAMSLAVIASHAQGTFAGGVKDVSVEEQVGKHPMKFNASFQFGSGNVANHYISAQECSGLIYGMHIDFGRFYTNCKNVSWNMSFDYLSSADAVGGLENVPLTSSMSFGGLSLNYSAFYNWTFGNGLMVKAGGGLDLAGDMTSEMVYKTNNSVSVNILAQLEASAGVSYVFNFEKWKLGLSGNFKVPFAGLVFTDSRHESGWGSLSSDGLMDSYDSHLKGTSFSNLKGFDCDFGIKFITKRASYDLGIVSDNRWWYVNDIQNYRTDMLFRVGVSFNLVSLKPNKKTLRYF